MNSVKWDTSGIAIYFFPRGSEPADITAEKPEPDSWGAAMARWPAASCDPFKFFKDHRAIFDTTLWYVVCSQLSLEWKLIIVYPVATGLQVYGHPLEFLDRNRAVLRKLVLLLAKNLYEQVDLHSRKLVCTQTVLVVNDH